MLENDKAMLQQTLDVISTMSGINEVNMYTDTDSLAYTSISRGLTSLGNPNCRDCHADLSSMFHPTEKAYRIIEHNPGCGVFEDDCDCRHLLIRKPILNERSCYTANCHFHSATDEVLGSLLINLPLEDLDSFMQTSSRDFLLMATLITILLVTFLVIFTRKRIKDPLNAIISASEMVSKGDHSIRLDVQTNLLDDIKSLSMAFNKMLDNIESASKELQNWSQQLEYKVQRKTEELSQAQNELIHVERIASLGKLSSSVAHEINNPLSGILIYTKLISKQLNNQEFHHPKKDTILRNLKLIETETKRCGDIVKGLLDFSRKDMENFEPAHLHDLLKATRELLRHAIKIADINFITELKAGEDQIYCSPNQIKQACVALLVNASEAIGKDGEIIMKTSNPDEKSIKLNISDNGHGIAEENISHIFEPFFSTKRESSGIGLGLAIVHGIIENHKGWIEVDSEVGKGTTISITFPLHAK
jgi:two-component system NtrC family sensor kinase